MAVVVSGKPDSVEGDHNGSDGKLLRPRDSDGQFVTVGKSAKERKKRTTQAITRFLNAKRSLRLAKHIAEIIEHPDSSDRDRIAAWNALQPYMLDKDASAGQDGSGHTFVFVLPEQARQFSAKHVDNEA